LARSQTLALPSAGVDSVNEQQLRNQFRRDLSTLIEEVRHLLEYAGINPYSRDSANTLHEHNTRIFFFDRLLTILGWKKPE
jgi:hypothetical protein